MKWVLSAVRLGQVLEKEGVVSWMVLSPRVSDPHGPLSGRDEEVLRPVCSPGCSRGGSEFVNLLNRQGIPAAVVHMRMRYCANISLDIGFTLWQ